VAPHRVACLVVLSFTELVLLANVKINNKKVKLSPLTGRGGLQDVEALTLSRQSAYRCR
jgi:hypothetical protein